MEFRERQDGHDRSSPKGPADDPPCPPLPQNSSLADLIPVPFGYTLSVPTLAGPICAENERLKIWLKLPVGLPGALAKEDHTAPYQTAPQQLHGGVT